MKLTIWSILICDAAGEHNSLEPSLLVLGDKSFKSQLHLFSSTSLTKLTFWAYTVYQTNILYFLDAASSNSLVEVDLHNTDWSSQLLNTPSLTDS